MSHPGTRLRTLKFYRCVPGVSTQCVSPEGGWMPVFGQMIHALRKVGVGHLLNFG